MRPARKVYRCAACDVALGGPDERVAPVDESDYAKLGLEPPQPAERATGGAGGRCRRGPPARPDGPDRRHRADEPPPLAPLGEPGGPPPPPARAPDPPLSLTAPEGPRYASTVRPTPLPAPVGTDVLQALAYQQLRDRFPVLDERGDVVDEVLDLYTSRNLYALQTIANKIDAEFHDQPLAAVFRSALAGCLLPASRLNGYPGPRRVPADQRRPRPSARVPPSPRGQRLAPVRGRVPGRAHRPGGAGPRPPSRALRRRPGRAGRA